MKPLQRKATVHTTLPDCVRVAEPVRALAFTLEGCEYTLFAIPTGQAQIPSNLSRAEYEVVAAVLAGDSNAQIARRRGRSMRTVANQLSAVYKKLGVFGRTELVRYCHEASLR